MKYCIWEQIQQLRCISTGNMGNRTSAFLWVFWERTVSKCNSFCGTVAAKKRHILSSQTRVFFLRLQIARWNQCYASCVKWIVHPENIYSPSCCSNRYGFLSSIEHKIYFEESGQPNICWSPLTSIVWKMGTRICLVTQLLQNIFFYVQQKKEIPAVLEQLVGE